MKQKCKRFRLVKGKIVWSKTFAKIDAINERNFIKNWLKSRRKLG